MKRETALARKVLKATGRLEHCRMYSNPTGVAVHQGRTHPYGLSPGSPDKIGYRSLVITQEMVGRTIAQFVCFEVKNPCSHGEDCQTCDVEPRQKDWLYRATKYGCLARVVRSPERAVRYLLEDLI